MSKTIKQLKTVAFTIDDGDGDWQSILTIMSANELPDVGAVRYRGASVMAYKNTFPVASADAMVVLTSACSVLSAATHMPFTVSRRWVTNANAIADGDSITVEFEMSHTGSVRVIVEGATINWHLTTDYDGDHLSLDETFAPLDHSPSLMCIDDAVYKRATV